VAVIIGRGVKCRLLSFGEGGSVLSEYVRLKGESGKFRHGRHTQLSRNALAVAFDRPLGNAEIIGKLLIQPPEDYVAVDLARALGQGPNSLKNFPSPRSLLAVPSIPRYGAPDRIQ